MVVLSVNRKFKTARASRETIVTREGETWFTAQMVMRILEVLIRTCLDVAVARARNMTLAAVNVVERYELNVDFSDESESLDRK